MTCMSIANGNLPSRHPWWTTLIFEVINLEYSSFCLLQVLIANILFDYVTAAWVLIIDWILSTWFCIIWLISCRHAALNILIWMIVFLYFFCDAGSTHKAFIILIFCISLIEMLPLEILTCTKRSTTLEMRRRSGAMTKNILVKSATSWLCWTSLILIYSLLPPPMLHRVLCLSII